MRMLYRVRNKAWFKSAPERTAQNVPWPASAPGISGSILHRSEQPGGRAPAGAGQVPARFAPYGHSLAAVDGRWRGPDLTHTFPRG